jgi:hypothetical protein
VKILVACEYSGRVRDAFIKLGHDAISCDLLPTEQIGPHYQGDVFDIINDGFDLMIAHPPCTHLAVSGARYFKEKIADGRQQSAIDFFMKIAGADIEKIAIENPVCIMSKIWRKPDQYIQPWQHGHNETKKTGIWLKNLPILMPTNIVEPDFMRNDDGSFKLDKKGKKYSKIHWMSRNFNGIDRAKARSITYQGIADSMANQWGIL